VIEGDVRPGVAREPDGGRVTMLEQGLWRQLARARTAEEAARSWAPLMFAQVDEVEACCVFLVDREGGRLRAVANWPEARIPGGALLGAAETAVESDQGVVRGTLEAGGEPVALAAPLTVDGSVVGAVGLEARPATQTDLRAAMRRLQWGAAWLRDHLRRDAATRAGEKHNQAMHALNAVISVAEQRDIATAARAAATDLATRFDCDRVSIGFRRLGRCKVAAISHSAQFGKRMNLVRLLAAAMDEAVDQRGVVLYPTDRAGEPMATHRHEKLARAYSVGHVVSVPLYAIDRFAGAIVYERPEGRPFTQDDLEILEAVSSVLAPVLDEKRRNDRLLVTKAFESVATQFARLVGPGRLGRKTALAVLVALIAFFWFARGADRISADAVVEGAVKRTLAAPFDGFIAESFARAGDTVEAGDLLVQLDNSELALERLRLVTELERQRIEFDRALAGGDRAESLIRRSQIAQYEAQIALTDRQIERTRLLAPFDGLVISGDLSQSIGASVSRGEALLAVAPAGQYRVTLDVDERRISDVALDQVGTLVVTALPQRDFPIVVSKITPVAEYGDGATTFRVEAALVEEAEALQPGMAGVAKIDIAEARLIEIWTRPPLDWLRIQAWRWLGLTSGSGEL
jgi:hypothetical protein